MELALTDKFGLFTCGAGSKLIWEQIGEGKKWVGGFSCDLGFLLPLGDFRFGGSARNLFGMPTISETKRYELGASAKMSTFIFNAGAGTQDMIAKYIQTETKKNWGYGIEWQALDNTAIRGGRFMEQGRLGESLGATFNQTSSGMWLGYSVRRFSDDPKKLTHWISYTFSGTNSIASVQSY